MSAEIEGGLAFAVIFGLVLGALVLDYLRTKIRRFLASHETSDRS